MKSLGFLLCVVVLASCTTQKVTLTVTGARPVTVGKTLALTAVLSDGKTHGITWTVTPAETGSVGADGVFHALAVGTATVHGQVDQHPEGTADVTIQVAAVPSAAVTVDQATLVAGATATAEVPTQADMTYLWSVTGEGGQLVGPSTQPAARFTRASAGTLTAACRVTNLAGDAAEGQVGVTFLAAAAQVSIAFVSGPPGAAVDLTPDGGSPLAFTDAGTYTVPPGEYDVVATSPGVVAGVRYGLQSVSPTHLSLAAGVAGAVTATYRSQATPPYIQFDPELIVHAGQASASVLGFTQDGESPFSDMRVDIVSSNPSVVPLSDVTLTVSTLTVTPHPGALGHSDLDITITDPSGLSASKRVRVYVYELLVDDPAATTDAGTVLWALQKSYGDTIQFDDALAGESLAVDGRQVQVAASALLGPDGGLVTLDCDGGGFPSLPGVQNTAMERIRLINCVDQRGYGGGAILVNGNLHARDCVFENNTAANTGGALFIQGDSSFDRCTFIHNRVLATAVIPSQSAQPAGGALFTYGNSTIRNCTFIGNSVSSTATDARLHGGAIYSGLNGHLEIISSTFVGNNTQDGGAAVDADFNVVATVTNSAFAGNGVDLERTLAGTFTSGGYNSTENLGGVVLAGPGDATGAVLASLGLPAAATTTLGLVPTLVPAAGSPLLGHVPASALPVDLRTDARGAPRRAFLSDGGLSDIGAVERQPSDP